MLTHPTNGKDRELTANGKDRGVPANGKDRGITVTNACLLESTINRYRSAVEKLAKSYFDRRAVAIVLSDGRLGATHVVGKFLELFGEDADVSSITKPCPHATGFMQQIVTDIGFSTGDLNLQDLESVLELFLKHQSKKNRRTIIAVHEFDAHGWWVLDKIRRLIELEAEQKNGLLVVLSGTPSSSTVLNEPILDVIAKHAGERIVLAPFTLSETRDFVRRLAESSMAVTKQCGDVGEFVEFFAVTLMHELCAGVPDDVYKVFNLCLKLVKGLPNKKISVDVVKEAAVLAGLTEPEVGTESGAGEDEPQGDLLPLGCLVVEDAGAPTLQVPLDRGSIVFGRDRLCDVCVSGLRISRFHAIFSMSPDGLVVADLGSTNGTSVNDTKIERYTLVDGDVVTMGMTRVRYVAGSEQSVSSTTGSESKSRVDTEEVAEPPINYVGDSPLVTAKS